MVVFINIYVVWHLWVTQCTTHTRMRFLFFLLYSYVVVFINIYICSMSVVGNPIHKSYKERDFFLFGAVAVFINICSMVVVGNPIHNSYTERDF